MTYDGGAPGVHPMPLTCRRETQLGCIGRGMLGVGSPVLEIGRGQGPIVDHEEVFTVLALGGFGEIKTPGDKAVGAQNHVF